MAEKDSRETRGKDGRPVTLPGLYELLQQWQPLEEGDETASESAPTTTSIADNPRSLWRAIARASREAEATESSEQLESWQWPEPQAQHSASHSRRASRHHKLVAGDAGPLRRHGDRHHSAVRLLRRALRRLKLRAQTGKRRCCNVLATQAQLPAPNTSSLFLTASPPTSAEEARRLHEQAHAEHRAWVHEMRRRGRRLLAIPEPEPFWLPHMLDEGADADAADAAAAAVAAAAASAAAAAIEHRRQLWSATRSWSRATSDLQDAATSTSDSASDSATATSSSSSCSEQDAPECDKNLPSQENI